MKNSCSTQTMITGLKRIGLISLLIVNTFSAYSWGVTGHRIIGEIAENQLTDTAKRRINALLNNASIAMVANWGDEVRSDPAYDYTATWHYTNIDSGLTRTAFDSMTLSLNNGQNIYSTVTLTEYLRQIPNDTAMLKMLIHLVGDMHCPLHLGHAGDRGGNTVQITWFRNPTNLHSLWDSALIDSQKLSYTEYANHLMRIYPPNTPSFDGKTLTILDWAWNIYLRAQTVYASADETGKSYEYIYKYKSLWEISLVEAAEHLAALLNYIYN
ncbi:MAG: S1/P1 nuclease [Dysgonamonadaceae bacterium]|jgi:hypothetical protein|nr:S1/P1 nuclease [Dysgonamonadaceae bacterium]